MRYLLLLLIAGSVMGNGWETSRFFIRVNGSTVGEQTITEQRGEDTVTTKSVSTMTLKRGGQQLNMTEKSIQASRPDGTPVSLSYTFEQAGMTLTCRAQFKQDHIELEDGSILSIQPNRPVFLDFGTRLQIQRLIQDPSNPITFTAFSPTTRQPIQRSIRYEEPETHNGKRLHRIHMVDRLPNVELEQELLTDAEGNTLKSTSTIMGLTIETVSEDWETGTETEPEAPDILISTLFPAEHPFPSGPDIRQLTFQITGLPASFHIPDGKWQQVRRNGDSAHVQITTPEIRADMKAGTYPQALIDSPVVQTRFPEIRETVDRLRKNAPEDGAFAMAVMDHVYAFISRKGYGIGFGDTASILKKREGDCTEHAVLAMALLRAGGIPARAVMGLVSLNSFMGYHMWVEVFLDNHWIPMDPTFRQYRADASHIKLGTSLISDPGFQRDLYPLLQMVSELTISPVEAVRTNGSRIASFEPGVEEEQLLTPFGSFGPGEPFTWNPEPPGSPTSARKMGFLQLKRDGLRIDISLADAKARGETTALIRQLGNDFSPLSFETMRGEPVAFGMDGNRLVMFIVRDGTVLQFTFAGPSDTIGETMKERAYDICLNLLSNGKGTNTDRR